MCCHSSPDRWPVVGAPAVSPTRRLSPLDLAFSTGITQVPQSRPYSPSGGTGPDGPEAVRSRSAALPGPGSLPPSAGIGCSASTAVRSRSRGDPHRGRAGPGARDRDSVTAPTVPGRVAGPVTTRLPADSARSRARRRDRRTGPASTPPAVPDRAGARLVTASARASPGRCVAPDAAWSRRAGTGKSGRPHVSTQEPQAGKHPYDLRRAAVSARHGPGVEPRLGAQQAARPPGS